MQHPWWPAFGGTLGGGGDVFGGRQRCPTLEGCAAGGSSPVPSPDEGRLQGLPVWGWLLPNTTVAGRAGVWSLCLNRVGGCLQLGCAGGGGAWGVGLLALDHSVAIWDGPNGGQGCVEQPTLYFLDTKL